MPRTVNMSDEMMAMAEQEIVVSSRSLADQIEHWARIGRAIEESPSFDYQRVKAALTASIPYDDLNSAEKTVYLDEMDELSWAEPSAEEKAFYAKLTGPGLDENGKIIYPDDPDPT
ncbi:hypothetical protein FT643_21950 [Ketobacter sp. MCCC 1A13808]|uniref:TA system antitoxin ParD family protein n=1 Tax=Ketobacter sp. MCCC 1A13808 TaxID=2602738 RepID=UPI0012EC9C60|nr:hypothetical protein [Ketobacter sp. MCCC 1A13808]MVF14805.1 hypothetical protein [Ketobacter sp. MCCC 1A13808]